MKNKQTKALIALCQLHPPRQNISSLGLILWRSNHGWAPRPPGLEAWGLQQWRTLGRKKPNLNNNVYQTKSVELGVLIQKLKLLDVCLSFSAPSLSETIEIHYEEDLQCLPSHPWLKYEEGCLWGDCCVFCGRCIGRNPSWDLGRHFITCSVPGGGREKARGAWVAKPCQQVKERKAASLILARC